MKFLAVAAVAAGLLFGGPAQAQDADVIAKADWEASIWQVRTPPKQKDGSWRVSGYYIN